MVLNRQERRYYRSRLAAASKASRGFTVDDMVAAGVVTDPDNLQKDLAELQQAGLIYEKDGRWFMVAGLEMRDNPDGSISVRSTLANDWE